MSHLSPGVLGAQHALVDDGGDLSHGHVEEHLRYVQRAGEKTDV